ncbi:MAG: hypothetical protein SOU19_01550 [Candidatus Caccosoma sp.]|nr:hypothetical protein [Candidatus Caccosoma sp.]
MKAKIYPYSGIVHEIEAINSSFCLQIEIICASLAKGTSTIKGLIDNKEIDTTIAWCKSIGAIIKKGNDKLVIKGIDNHAKISNALFVCDNTSSTAKLMIPLLCCNPRPFGIKANEMIVNEIIKYQHIYENYGIKFYVEDDLIRFEKMLEAKPIELEGDIDIYFMTGLFIALPLLDDNFSIQLRAPIRYERNYQTIVKILKRFHVDVKRPTTTKFDFPSKQSYIHSNIKTEIDKFYLAHLALLSNFLTENDNKILVTNYNQVTTQDGDLLFEYLRKSSFKFTSYFFKFFVKKKESNVYNFSLSSIDSLPIMMVLAILSNNKCTINGVDINKPIIKNEYEIMQEALRKMNVECNLKHQNLSIIVTDSLKKAQVDCQNNPYVLMALTYLGLLGNTPVVIRNADCIYSKNYNFYDYLKEKGAKIEFIND